MATVLLSPSLMVIMLLLLSDDDDDDDDMNDYTDDDDDDDDVDAVLLAPTRAPLELAETRTLKVLEGLMFCLTQRPLLLLLLLCMMMIIDGWCMMFLHDQPPECSISPLKRFYCLYRNSNEKSCRHPETRASYM
jgi:hypothetical protein